MLDKLRIFGTAYRPNKVRIFLRIIKFSHKILLDAFYDVSRYMKYSSSYHLEAAGNLKSRITAKYHEIEKGLSLRSPRKGFGAQRLNELILLIREYIERYGMDDFLSAPASTLRAYAKFNEEIGLKDYPCKANIQSLLKDIEAFSDANIGGVLEISSKLIHDTTKNIPDEFFLRRYSIRQFSPEPVKMVDIDAAVSIALKAPAVCNRQDGYVHIIEDKNLILEISEMHGGAKGFSEQIDKLLVITNKLTNFWDSGERNQCWIDGGLFSMSLILGLHAKGIGTCCLNWSKSASDDRAMRKRLGLPDSEVIIMMLAVGSLPDSLKVAYSNRKSVEEARSFITQELTQSSNS